MPDSTRPNLSDLHHYPPTTADWVRSPLLAQDDLPHNPVEAPPPGVKPRFPLGAALVIGGGLLAIVGSLMQLPDMIPPATWYLWLVAVVSILALAAVIGSLLLLYRVTALATKRVIFFAWSAVGAQIVQVVLTLTGAHARTGLGIGVWVAFASIFMLLLGGGILRFGGHPQMSGQDHAAQTARERRVDDYTRGGKFLGGWRQHWDPPLSRD